MAFPGIWFSPTPQRRKKRVIVTLGRWIRKTRAYRQFACALATEGIYHEEPGCCRAIAPDSRGRTVTAETARVANRKAAILGATRKDIVKTGDTPSVPRDGLWLSTPCHPERQRQPKTSLRDQVYLKRLSAAEKQALLEYMKTL